MNWSYLEPYSDGIDCRRSIDRPDTVQGVEEIIVKAQIFFFCTIFLQKIITQRRVVQFFSEDDFLKVFLLLFHMLMN